MCSGRAQGSSAQAAGEQFRDGHGRQLRLVIGLALGTFVRPGLLAMPAAVGAAVFLFGTRGIYPLLPMFRRLGIRTAREIERERYAVKALRGDFDAMPREAQPRSDAAHVESPAPVRHCPPEENAMQLPATARRVWRTAPTHA